MDFRIGGYKQGGNRELRVGSLLKDEPGGEPYEANQSLRGK
jgi:hypothetical protein